MSISLSVPDFRSFQSPAQSLLANRCFPPLKCGRETKWIPRSLVFLDVLGAAYCRLRSQVTRRQATERMKERKKLKWSHIRCPRSLGESFNKKMLWIPLKCYCSQFRYLARSFSCIPSLLAEAYAFLCVWQEWYTTWRQPLKNDAALYISYSEWVCCQLALRGKKSYCIIRVSCVSLLSMC